MFGPHTHALIAAALAEDLADRGDITAALLPDGTKVIDAAVVPRCAGVLCGLVLIPTILRAFEERGGGVVACLPDPRNGKPIEDGSSIVAGEHIATIRGPRAAVLAVERTLLNFLTRMSGVATLTRRYVDAARAVNPRVQVLDTRKTIPGWRELDKYAVRCGGGTNHRFGLFDAILIKDNHLAGVPSSRLAATLSEMLNHREQGTGNREQERPGGASAALQAFVEVEVDSLEQLREVCRVVGVNYVLLDNFNLHQLRAAVVLRDSLGLRGKVELEASGGVTLDTIAEIAATGVERISVGAITHSAPGLDIALDLPAGA
ncbi:MAG: nicotinate-nucleotide diphosphorylase [Phycisphaerae bacterium]